MQQLWLVKLGWDEPLPPSLSKIWIEYIQSIPALSTINIPRWVKINHLMNIEIHGFGDASQCAYSAVVYFRATSSSGDTSISLVCAKTKVAPLKKLTIPRLELSASVLLTKLVTHVISTLKLQLLPVYLWTDSSIVFTWINSHPSKWKDFIQNRVCFIHDTLSHAKWKHVPGKDNPADCASRGWTANELKNHPLWWTGPPWLKERSDHWPNNKPFVSKNLQLEERPQKVYYTQQTDSEYDKIIKRVLNRHSNLNRLVRSLATLFRCIKVFKKAPASSLSIPLSPIEIQDSMTRLAKFTQTYHFKQEINLLVNKKPIQNSSSLLKLTPYIDDVGVLRVGGRLKNSLLDHNAKHPIILPKQSNLTELIIRDAHNKTLHGGTQITLSQIRTNYWILGGRVSVRSYILKCVKCTRYRQLKAKQLMGQPPVTRVTPSRAFLHSGVDYAGPFTLKAWSGRKATQYKAYFVLFICFSTSAIHIELVSDYSANAFLAAYRRFTSRRGICGTLTSDQGTNLTGADKELKKLFNSASAECKTIAHLLATDGTKWNFNPPGAPHFGGKWEAGVKSVKFHLKRVIGQQQLTYEEMSTLLIQTEGILNSRPLTPLTEDLDDVSALTPGHFLIGGPLSTIPEPSYLNLKQNRLSRYQLMRQMISSFWERWSKECLQRYLSI